MRDKSAKAKDLLRADQLPAEFYGRGVENKSLQMDYQTFRKVFRKAGTNTIIELKVDGAESINVLVHEIQRDPVTDRYTHIDFINVRMGEELHTKIPVEFVGTAPAVKDMAGTLTVHLNEIEIKCLPKDLIHSIEVDISSLVDFHTFIRVKDLNVPSTIAVLNEPEDVVVTVTAPRVEEEATESAEGAEGATVPAEGSSEAAAGGEAGGE